MPSQIKNERDSKTLVASASRSAVCCVANTDEPSVAEEPACAAHDAERIVVATDAGSRPPVCLYGLLPSAG